MNSFYFTHVFIGCDQTISTASGIVASPNYPNERPSYYFCNWKITVPLGRRVTLITNDIDLVGSTMEQRITVSLNCKFMKLTRLYVLQQKFGLLIV